MLPTALSSAPSSAHGPRLPRTLAGWAGLFDVATLPVLAATVEQLDLARTNEDAADAHSLGEMDCGRPLDDLEALGAGGAGGGAVATAGNPKR